MVAVELRLESDVHDLQELLSKYALKIAPPGKPFILASGQESNVYFDVKIVTLAPESFWTVGRLFWEQAKRFEATAVGGLAAGSIPISMAVIGYDAHHGTSSIRSFYVRDAQKSHGTKETLYQSFDPERVDGVLNPSSRIVLVDDVLTSGKSISQAADEIQRRGGAISAIVVLVDRQAGGAAVLRERYGVPVVALFKMDGDGTLRYHGTEVH